MFLSSFVVPNELGRRRPRPASWQNPSRPQTILRAHTERPSTAGGFQPTADQVLQSRLNEIESQQMAAASESPPTSPTSRTIRMLQSLAAFAKQPLSPRSLSRRESPLSRSSTAETPLTSRARAFESQTARIRRPAPRFVVPSDEPSARQMLQTAADNRDRELRMLRPKHEFSTDDLNRMDIDAANFRQSIQGASPNALYACQRQSGLTTEISEFHGFCHSTPLNVRICVSPIFDKDTTSMAKPLSRVKLSQAFTKEKVKNRWSKICVGGHGLAYETPMIPFDRMLKLKFINFLRAAESGDILMEGALFDEAGRYTQYKTKSLTSYVSVVYKDPVTEILYALTSRKWSKSIRQLHERQQCMADLASLQLVHGVQMHPLEEYVHNRRREGTYFIFRRLQRSQSRITTNERLAVGEGIHEWYMQHRGQPCPNMTEHRTRIKIGKQSATALTENDVALAQTSTISASQAVTLALQSSGVLSATITARQAHFSCSGYFETRSVDMATAPDGEHFKYDFLAYIDSAEGYAPRGHAAITTRSMINTETGDV